MDQGKAREGGSRAPATSPYRRPLREPPRIARSQRAWIRAALAAVVMLTLPFAWSEDFTCSKEPQPTVTGAEILFHKLSGPEVAVWFFGLFIVAVGLGFVAARTWRVVWQLVCHVVAGLAGVAAFLFCVAMMSFGRKDQPLVYPAAWIGTLTTVAMALEAWFASGQSLRRLLADRRAARALEASPLSLETAPIAMGDIESSTAAEAPSGAQEPAPEPEEEEHAADEARAEKRA
ncbi:Hypothetical protein A7982_11840 [Minicystis rosea]|nr:Hypothetical protein A7982_11840 [Minicystis rosea]